MLAEELIRTEDLSGTLSALEDEVRANPEVAHLRVFLFQLLAVIGQWDRAVRQLQTAAQLSPDARIMAQTYREAIVCELFREKVFAGEKRAMIFGTPAEWTVQLVEAQRLLATGHVEEAATLRAMAFEAAPATAGRLNGAEFQWVADADMRLGPVLEAIVNGRYYWMPFSALASVAIEEPTDLRDLVWAPATLTLRNGGETVALVPTRYAGTADRGSDTQKLARETAWTDVGAETFVGLGQRLIATDGDTTALLDIRKIELDGEPV